jgi:hypothetical protein
LLDERNLFSIEEDNSLGSRGIIVFMTWAEILHEWCCLALEINERMRNKTR